jgi:peptidyl-prolyl cis-trans isomerase D
MLDLFRRRDKAVRILLGGLLLLVALSMLTYLVPSYGTGGSSGTDTVVAEVGRDAITVPDVQQVIQMNLRGNRMPPEMAAFQIPRIIDSIVTEHALAYEAQRMGFTVSDDELVAGIRQTIPQLFPDGKFAGKDAYAQTLAQQNMTIPQFETDLKRQLLITKLRDVALEGAVVTPQEIEQAYTRRNEKVRIEYVKIAGDKLRAQVQISPDELKKSYEANKPLYQVPEKRDLGIVVVDQAKLEQTIQPTDDELQKAYNENRDAYRVPEHVDVRHILLKTTGMDAKQEAAVKTKADDLVKQLRGGADFTGMVKKYSEDPASVPKGGVYDGVVRGQMVPEFEKAAFSLKVNEISEPIKTTYGYHILQVLKHEPAQMKPFSDVKTQLAGEYKKQRVSDMMQTLSDKAQAALTKDPQHPDKVAADLGLQYVKADNVGPGDPVPEIGVNKEFGESIASLKKGEVTQEVQVGKDKIVVAVCLGETASHPAALEEVEGKVRDAATRDKLNRLIDEKATELMDKVHANGGDLEAAAKSLGLEMKTPPAVDRNGAIEGLGSAGTLLDAFNKPAGSIFGPNAIADGKIVGKVLEKTPPDPAGLAAQRVGIRDQLKGQKGQSRNALFEEGLRDALNREGKLKVHQDVVSRIVASYHS